MIDHIKTYLTFGTVYCGIEHGESNKEESINGVLIKKDKDELGLMKSFKLKSVNELVGMLNKEQHIFLVLNDHQVLMKAVDTAEADHIKIVNQTFPNINLEEFYYEVLRQGTKQFITVCRKAHVHEVINQYKEIGFQVIGFSLGHTSIGSIAKWLPNNSINTSSAELSIKDQMIVDIKEGNSVDQQSLDINGLPLTNDSLLAFSGLISDMIRDTTNELSNLQSFNELLLNQFRQLRFFRQGLKFGLCSMLLILLINFMFFNHYYTKVEDYKANTQASSVTKQKIKEITARIEKSERRITEVQKGSESKTSILLNDIIKDLPESILLNNFNYQPQKRRIKHEQEIALAFNKIHVVGETADSKVYQDWINKILLKPWAKEVVILNYTDINKNRAKFEFNITINDL